MGASQSVDPMPGLDLEVDLDGDFRAPAERPDERILREADRDAKADFALYKQRYDATFAGLRGAFRTRSRASTSHAARENPRAPSPVAESVSLPPPPPQNESDALQRALARLRGQSVRGTSETVIGLLRRCWEPAGNLTDEMLENKWLGSVGMRACRACQKPGRTEDCRCPACRGRRGRGITRLGPGAGVWLDPAALRLFFRGDPDLGYDQGVTELLRVGTRSPTSVRIHGGTCRAIWLPREVIDDGSG